MFTLYLALKRLESARTPSPSLCPTLNTLPAPTPTRAAYVNSISRHTHTQPHAGKHKHLYSHTHTPRGTHTYTHRQTQGGKQNRKEARADSFECKYFNLKLISPINVHTHTHTQTGAESVRERERACLKLANTLSTQGPQRILLKTYATRCVSIALP